MINVKNEFNSKDYAFFLEKSFLGSIQTKEVIIYQAFLKEALPRLIENSIVYSKIEELLSKDNEFLVVLE